MWNDILKTFAANDHLLIGFRSKIFRQLGSRRSKSLPRCLTRMAPSERRVGMARSPSYTPRSASLSWSGIFCRRPSVAEPGSEEDDDRSRSSTALDRTPVRAGVDQPLVILP